MRLLLAAAVLMVLLGLAPSAHAQLFPRPTPTATPAPPAPPVVEPAPPGPAALTGGQDTARSSASADASLKPPFGVRWRHRLPTTVGSVVAADGRVVAARARASSGGGAVVEAFDARSGAKAWSVELQQTYSSVGLAYADGRVFVADTDDRVRALEAATGRQLWVTEVGDGSDDSPVVAGGLVIVQGGEVTALDVATGARAWSSTFGDGTDGEPAVAGDRVYALGACSMAAFDRRNGRVLWTTPRNCTGGGGGRVVLWKDRAIGAERTARVGPRAAADGAPVTMPAAWAVSGNLGIVRTESRNHAHDLATGDRLWSAPGGRPLLLPSSLFLVSGSVVGAYDLANGRLLWGGRIAQANGDSSSYAVAGAGALVVVEGDTLIALGPAGRGERITSQLSRREQDVLSRTWVTLNGRAGEAIVAGQVRLEIDRHPFGRFERHGRTISTDARGRYAAPYRPSRNTRLRVVTQDGRRSPARTVYAYPRISTSIRQWGGKVRVTLRVAPRNVSLRGRRAAVYLRRAGSDNLRRLASARVGAGNRARLSFAPLARVGRRDRIYSCVRGSHRMGLGRPDLFSLRCGNARIRF